MKNTRSIYSLATIIAASLLLWSCGRADGEFTGSEYMPDMGHSIAYEANVNTYYYNNTWGTEEAYYDMAHPRKPVKGTVARGYLPSKYQYLEDFRATGEETQVILQEKVRKMIIVDASIVNPIQPRNADELAAVLEKGAHLYKINCEVCHGETGDGNGVLYNGGDGKYSAKPANFINDDFYKDGNTDGRFLNAILHGKGMMQSHADKLSPAERWEVIHYIRSLQATEKGVDYNPVAAVNVAPSMEETMEAVTEEHTEEQHEEAHDGDGHGK